MEGKSVQTRAAVRWTFKKSDPKKHSVVFRPEPAQDAPMSSIYVMNTALKELGWPETIVVTLEAK